MRYAAALTEVLRKRQAEYPEYNVVICFHSAADIEWESYSRCVLKRREDNLTPATFRYGESWYSMLYVIWKGGLKYSHPGMGSNPAEDYIRSSRSYYREGDACRFWFTAKDDWFRPLSWMRAFSGDTMLNDMVLPASHCSAIRPMQDDAFVGFEPKADDRQKRVMERQLRDGYACQETTIREQLRLGIRMVDLRCGMDVCLSNGPIRFREGIAPSLEACVDFVTENPSETVAVLIQWSWGTVDPRDPNLSVTFAPQTRDFAEGIRGHLINRKKWYTRSEWPKLDAVRGKCVFLRGFTSSIPAFGVDVTSEIRALDLPDDGSGTSLWKIAISASSKPVLAQRRAAIRSLHEEFRRGTIDTSPTPRWIFSDYVERDTIQIVVERNMSRP